jgi:hypothetical protein
MILATYFCLHRGVFNTKKRARVALVLAHLGALSRG